MAQEDRAVLDGLRDEEELPPFLELVLLAAILTAGVALALAVISTGWV